jgi:hypothetical protein
MFLYPIMIVYNNLYMIKIITINDQYSFTLTNTFCYLVVFKKAEQTNCSGVELILG